MENMVSLDERSSIKPNHSDLLIFEVQAKVNNWLRVSLDEGS